jgi:hypothetical protein
MRRSFAVILLRGVIGLFFLASAAGTLAASPLGQMHTVDAALEPATASQPACAVFRPDSVSENGAAKSEEGSACSSLKPRSLKLSELVGIHRISCRGHVCCRPSDEAASLNAASRISVQIAFCVWRS